eukprot:m.264577 g.264577  ORF g.264577 m.264577 type:complete len:177 (+) comp15618_c0_seq7:358-888(+)
MSNGGAIPFSSMVDLMQGIHLYQAVATRVRSVVFDSAPCYPSYTAAGGAMCHALGTANPLVHAVVSVLFGVGDTLLRLVRSTQATTYFWHRMQSWAINDKVLERYLVSPTDPLFDFDEGSSLVTHRQKQAPKRDIQLVNFQDTDHVLHLRQNPELYKESVREAVAYAAQYSNQATC